MPVNYQIIKWHSFFQIQPFLGEFQVNLVEFHKQLHGKSLPEPEYALFYCMVKIQGKLDIKKHRVNKNNYC